MRMQMRMGRARRAGWPVAILAASLFLLVAGSAGAAEAKKILVGQVTFSPYYWPNFVAVEKALFQAEHLDVELITIDSPIKTAQSLSAKALHVAWTPPDTLLLGRQKGAAVAIIGGAVEKPMYDLLTQPKYHSI